MTKKKQQEEIVVEKVAVAPKPKTIKPVKKDDWEVKDRTYILSGNKEPLTFTIPAKHTRRHPLLWYDSAKGEQRELRYATNMSSPFVDEQKGEVTLGHITFRDGTLSVSKEKIALQKLLSLYHPLRDKLYEEFKPAAIAEEEIDVLNMQVDALTAARNVDIDIAEAIMRAEVGSKVSELSSKELRRDLLVFARNNPKIFLELADDENVMLRNFGIKATENGILRLSSDQRNFLWGSNGRKVMTIPFDEHPYTALAHWFKTDEGMEIYQNIEKRLNN